MTEPNPGRELAGKPLCRTDACERSGEAHWCVRGGRDVYVGVPDTVGNTIGDLAVWLVDGGNHERMQHHVDRYFAPGAVYAGSRFEWFTGRSERSRFTPWDMLAVQALSVTVPTRVQHWLLTEPVPARHLDRSNAEFDEATIDGVELGLWNARAELTAALSDLYDLVRAQKGMGPVTTSKLLAAKFPNLVPIRDANVERLLGMTKHDEWWPPIATALGDEGSDQLAVLRNLNVPSDVGRVSVLRRLDVVLWMEERARSRRDGI